MAIKSSPFGGVEITGEDAAAFWRQVGTGPTSEEKRRAMEAIEHGKAMAAELARNGHVLIAIAALQERPK